MPCAMVTEPHMGQSGLLTNVKNSRRNHLMSRMSKRTNHLDVGSSPKQSSYNAILIPPLGLDIVAHRSSDTLHDIVFLLCFRV